jgi:hypothetical protein
MFSILIYSSFSKWNPLIVQPLKKLHTILHVVPRLLAESANILQDFPFSEALLSNFEKEP